MRVVIVDPHPVFRVGLRALIESRLRWTVAGEPGSTAEALNGLPGLNADLITVAVALPDADGIVMVRDLIERGVQARFLMLTRIDDADHVARAMAAGAAGYALKCSPIEETVEALHAVACGRTYLSPKASASIDLSHAGFAALTPREREVLDLIVCGLRGNDIAKRLFITPKTVESHRFKINRKLGVHSVAKLIRLAALNGAFGRERLDQLGHDNGAVREVEIRGAARAKV